MQNHFWFVSNIEHVIFEINEKYSQNNYDNPNYYASFVIFQTYKNIIKKNVHSLGWLLWLCFHPKLSFSKSIWLSGPFDLIIKEVILIHLVKNFHGSSPTWMALFKLKFYLNLSQDGQANQIGYLSEPWFFIVSPNCILLELLPSFEALEDFTINEDGA
jgi:hypothetical protein